MTTRAALNSFLAEACHARTPADLNIAAGATLERLERRRVAERILVFPLAVWGLLDLLSTKVPGFFSWLPVDDHVRLFHQLAVASHVILS